MLDLSRGERFKDARILYNQHGNQTMNAVQNATGVSASLIADLENDEKDRKANYLDVAKLAKHYGVTMDWLCGLSNDHHIKPCATSELGLSEKSIYSLKALTEIPILFDESWKSKNKDTREASNRRFWDLVESLNCLGTSRDREDGDYYANFLANYAIDLIDFLINVAIENFAVLRDFFDLKEVEPRNWDDEYLSFDDFVRFKAGEIAKVIDRWLVEEFKEQVEYFVINDTEWIPHPNQLSFDCIDSEK